MNRRLVIALVLLLPLFQGTVSAAGASLAARVIEASSSNKLVASIPDQLSTQYHNRKTTAANPEVERKATRVLLQTFDEARAQDILLKSISGKAGDADLQGILDWLESPLGKRFSAAEGAMQTTEGQQGLRAFAQEMNESPPPQERIELMLRFEQAARQSDTATAFFEIITRSLIAAAQQLTPEKDRLSADAVDRQFEQLKPKMRQALQQQMLLMAHYNYRDFSDAEIERYIAFLESDPGQLYSRIAIIGVTDVLDDLVARALPEIAKQEQR